MRSDSREDNNREDQYPEDVPQMLEDTGKKKSRKLRYICRLFCKELVQQNFPGLQTNELLERMIELSLYTEEHLK